MRSKCAPPSTQELGGAPRTRSAHVALTGSPPSPRESTLRAWHLQRPGQPGCRCQETVPGRTVGGAPGGCPPDMPATAPPPPPPPTLGPCCRLSANPIRLYPTCVSPSGGAGTLPVAPHASLTPLLSAFPWASWRPRPKPLLDTLPAGTETQMSTAVSLDPSQGQLPAAPCRQCPPAPRSLWLEPL